MLKILFIYFIGILIVIISFSLILNVFNNMPNIIARQVERGILNTDPEAQGGYFNWLWSKEREFQYDIIYMNIFSPGSVILSIKQGNIERGSRGFILKANLKERELFERIYDAQISITSQVKESSKIPLIYRESTITPEKKEEKVIIFKPEENIAERESSKYRIPDKTYDPLSVFFNFLSSDFRIDESITFNLISKKEIYEFKFTPKSFENNIYIIEAEVYRQDRTSTHGAKFTIWVFNDKVRVPLLIKVVSAAGPVYLRLKSVK